jgi:formylglycine-generating enzyme
MPVQAWLDSQPSTTGQDPACSWNTSYAPGGSDCEGVEWPPGKYGSAPVMCVDWCDAVAYCKSLSKRLCGKIGGGANGYDDYGDATKSQWFNACSFGGKLEYPYGNEYDKGAYCNDADRSGGVEGDYVPAGSLSECQSPENGYSGVYDLSGDVWEWEDSCLTIAGENTCRIRGGSIASGVSYASCGFDMASKSDVRNAVIGFRCCSP